MKSGSNIERRGRSGIFYFRRAVPDDLRKRGAPRDLRLSLRTNIRAEAIAAARHLNVLADRLFDQLRQGTNDMSVFTNISLELESTFKREMFLRHMSGFDQARDHEGRVSPEEAQAAARLAELNAHCFREELALNDHEMTAPFVTLEIADQNLDVSVGSTAWNKLLRAGKQVMEQVCLAEARRWHGDYDETPSYRALNLVHPSDLPAVAQSVAVLSQQAKRKLSEIYVECREHKIAHSEWKHATVLSKDVSIRLFQEIVGDLRFDLITADHAARFDRALRELPAMVGKSVYADLMAPEAIKHFQRLRAGIECDRHDNRISVGEANRRLAEAKCQPMAPHTRNKHINAMASVFTWARKVMKWGVEDHFAPFRMSRPARRKQPKKRIALQAQKLFQILQSPRFTGRKSELARWQTVPGDVVVKDGLYWSVLLEAFQGCRLDEGAKLRTFDVVMQHGMWCLKLNHDGDEDGRNATEDGTGKTSASKRLVPMHRDLVRLGLPEQARRMIEFYEKEGAKPVDRWLFPELKESKHHKTRSANLTKRWRTYMETLGLYRRWEDGHALRHTFNDTLLRAGVPDAVIKELIGHRREGMTEDTYFTPSTLVQLKVALNKLDYGLALEERDGEWQIVKPANL